MNASPINPNLRHQCLIYEGAPSRQLPALAAVMRNRLFDDYRCLYLNSPTMVAGMKSALAAIGVDVHGESGKGSLLLSSSREHLDNGKFNIDRIMGTLAGALQLALDEGYRGLFASGDMTWEMGSDCCYAKVVEYERRLDSFFLGHPELCGICQYHADTVPHETVRQALAVHPSIFVGEAVAFPNPYFVPAAPLPDK